MRNALAVFNLCLALAAASFSFYAWTRAKRMTGLLDEMTALLVRAQAERAALVQAFELQGQAVTLTWEDAQTLSVRVDGNAEQPTRRSDATVN